MPVYCRFLNNSGNLRKFNLSDIFLDAMKMQLSHLGQCNSIINSSSEDLISKL